MYKLATVVFTLSRMSLSWDDYTFRIQYKTANNSYEFGSTKYKGVSRSMVLLLLKNESQSSSTGSRFNQ